MTDIFFLPLLLVAVPQALDLPEVACAEHARHLAREMAVRNRRLAPRLPAALAKLHAAEREALKGSVVEGEFVFQHCTRPGGRFKRVTVSGVSGGCVVRCLKVVNNDPALADLRPGDVLKVTGVVTVVVNNQVQLTRCRLVKAPKAGKE